jgi:N-acetylneuraminic acid mutarotase
MHKLVPFTLVFLLLAGFFIVVIDSVSASSELIENSWNTKAPMSQARYGLGVVAVAGKIYAIGGDVGDLNFVGINERYDPKTDTWTTMTSMPTPRSDFAIVAYQNKIYCIGGIVDKIIYNNAGWATGVTCNIMEVYDIVTDSWSTKSALPIREAKARASAIDDKIFLIWGEDMFVYNIAADLWTTKMLPESCRVPSYVEPVVIDNKITYVDAIQFDKINGEASKFMNYDPKTDEWTEGKGNSFSGSERGGAAVITSGVYVSKKIYALDLDTVYVYDFKSNTWTFVAMPTHRLSFGAAMVNDVLYVIGGISTPDVYNWYTVGSVIAINEQYVPLGYTDSVFSLNTLVIVLILIVIIIIMAVLIFVSKNRMLK